MNSIQGVSNPNYYAATQTNKAPSATTTQTASRATVDYYIPGDALEVQNEVKTVKFTRAMATTMADKYDPTSMSRNEYTKLIVELRDAGVLSSREYSIAYSGKLPPSDQQVVWPQGSETTNFSQIIHECEALCTDYVNRGVGTDRDRSNGEELLSTYSKLENIFKNIWGAQINNLPVKDATTSGIDADNSTVLSREPTNDLVSDLTETYKVRNMSSKMSDDLKMDLRHTSMLNGKALSHLNGSLPSSGLGFSLLETIQVGTKKDFMDVVAQFIQFCQNYIQNNQGGFDSFGTYYIDPVTVAYSKIHSILSRVETAEVKTGAAVDNADEIARLTKELEADTDYVNSDADRHFTNTKVGRQLAKEIIMSSPELQQQIGEKIRADWSSILSIKWTSSPMDSHFEYMQLPIRYHGFDVNAMLNSGDQFAEDEVLGEFSNIIYQKSFSAEGLTDVERLLNGRAAKHEADSKATFNDRMVPVYDEIKKKFSEKGMVFDTNKIYEFSLDTSTFTFSVTGGTDEENALIEETINYDPFSNVYFNPFHKTICALYFHRRDDLSINPWRLQHMRNPEEHAARYGVGSVSAEYNKKMQQFLIAYERSDMDKNMHRKYGFGVDDISYQNGQWIGKTDEITKFIEQENADWKFEKYTGDAWLSNTRKYTGTPTFDAPVFVFDDGRFRVTYEEWE